MSPTKALEIIRAAVIAANPEIMKLQFGCEVTNGWASESNPHKKGFYIKTHQVQNQECYFLTDGKGEFWDTIYERGHKLEILGRKIGLADIVYLLLIKYPIGHSVYETLLRVWKYRSPDDINEQPDATKLFLASLLQSK